MSSRMCGFAIWGLKKKFACPSLLSFQIMANPEKKKRPYKVRSQEPFSKFIYFFEGKD
jgi:hypothetical protein